MVLEIARGTLALFGPANGREYARLEDPNQDGSAWYAFTPDGTRIVTSSEGDSGYVIHVWDLRLIREGLAEIGLDWDLPPYTPASVPTSLSMPLRFEVDRGQLEDDAVMGMNPTPERL